MPDVQGLLLSCGWMTTVATVRFLFTLFFRRTVSRKWCKVMRVHSHSHPLFLSTIAQTKQTTGDDHPDWLETSTNSVSSSSILPPIAVIFSFPSVWVESTSNSLRSSSALSRNPITVTALYHPESDRTTKCNKVSQGQWYCAGHCHPEGTEEYTMTLGNKNLGSYPVINL